MRHLFALFLSIFLCLNAAYAAATDICDLIEHDSEIVSTIEAEAISAHFGHHSHDHEHAVADQDDGETPGQNTQGVHAEHCHPHQCFTSVLPGEVLLPTQVGVDDLVIGFVEQLVSHPSSRLERPPIAVRA